jgi:predicted aspartyl protease
LPAKVLILCAALCFQGAFAAEPGVFIRQELPRVPSLITTKGTIGDAECALIIDTGSEVTVVDQSLAALLKGRIGDYSYSDGSGRKTPLPLYKAPTIKFQAFEEQDSTIAMLDVRPLAKYLDGSAKGVLGISQLKVGQLTVDNDRGILELHAAPWKLSGDSFTEVDLQDYVASPILEASINLRHGEFLIDTGYMGTILLDKALFSALVRNGSIELAESEAHTLSVSGTTDVRSGWFLKGELMGKGLVGTAVHETMGPSAVGMEWLYGFNYELDFKSHRFRYKERRDPQFPASTNLMIGAILTFGSGGPVVERLSPDPDGAAKLAGLNPGDVLKTFDSLTTAELNYTAITEIVTNKAGQPIQIRYFRKSDGAELETTLHLRPLISPWNFGGRTSPALTTSP